MDSSSESDWFNRVMDQATVSNPSTPSVSPLQSSSGMKVIILICLLVLLGVNVFAILAHTTAFAGSTTAAAVREFTGQLVELMGLTTKGAVATVQGIDKQIEASLDSVSRATLIAGQTQVPKPDSSMTSEVQCRGKQGWCYVGTQDGYRSCLQVGAGDYCQSGNVYSSKQLCSDPSLRQ